MFLAVWSVFLLVMLFLLGSAVGSFLNVCIVRLPQGRSLIRPASCCGHCHKPIRTRDNIPLVSYWLLRGRCRACGTPFSMRYFWIELLTGLVFVLIYWLEIGCNIHHYRMLAAYDSYYEYLLMGVFRPRPWLVFVVHALLVCFLIVAAMCSHDQHKVPRSVTGWGVLLGLVVSLLFPWPWPDETVRGVPSPSTIGLYPWPIWSPLPDWLPPNSWRLGLATGLAGVLASAILMALARLSFNAGLGTAAVGWGETSLLMIAGGFLGWQPIVVAGLLGLVPGLIVVVLQGAMGKRQHVSFSIWLALAVAVVWLGWHWIGPPLQGLFFNAARLLLFAVVCVASLPVFTACLGLLAVARPAPRP
jgi:leader peptidase (prepilin peptidase)/N-methyltransferase